MQLLDLMKFPFSQTQCPSKNKQRIYNSFDAIHYFNSSMFANGQDTNTHTHTLTESTSQMPINWK